ncbi:uncharacterized protein LOC120347153 [Styela clava]
MAEKRLVFVVVIWMVLRNLVLTKGTFIANEKCEYKKFTSSNMNTMLHRGDRKGMKYLFETRIEAEKICNALTSCTGIILDELSQGIAKYKLGAGFPTTSHSSKTLWVKECNPNCKFVRRFDVETGLDIYERECSTPEMFARNGKIEEKGNWSFWGPWGRCSRSCGPTGTQMRSRYCIPDNFVSGTCNGTKEEFRQCNTEVYCLKQISEVYGINGPEGLVSIGKARIYKSCVHREPSMRLPCGDQSTITRDKCNQFKCCFQENFRLPGITEGPKCFQTQSFIGSNGRLGWAVWSSWSPCSVTCRNGERIRRRMCTGDISGSTLCPGTDLEVEICTLGPCPCDRTPCQNGGTCIVNDHVMTGYECKCAKGFAGKNCLYAEPELTCEENFISISFDEGIVRDDGLISDPTLIQFKKADSKDCFAEIRGSMFVLALPQPIDKSCGSELQTDRDKLIIRNQVLWRLSDSFVDSTVVIVDITCVYNKQVNSTVGLGFGIIPTVRTISERKVTEAVNAEMFIYRDDSFLPSHRYRNSPKIAQGEVLYLSVDLLSIGLSGYESMVILADKCWVADSTKERNVVHDLINDGCSTNAIFTTVILNGVGKQARWALRIFDWKYKDKESKEVYLQCRVRVCLKNCEPICDDKSSTNRNKPALSLTQAGRKRRSTKTTSQDSAGEQSHLVMKRIILI